MRGVRGLLVAVLLSSAAEPRWGLKFTAPDSCITAAALAERIEARLGRPLFGARPDVLIEGHVTPEHGALRWRARLTLVDADGTVKGSREVTSADVSCRSIDESLALVAAVMIDPASALRDPHAPAPAPPIAEPTPPPPPSSQNEVRPPMELRPRPALPREEWSGYILYERGQFLRDGRWLDRGNFYRIVGRTDLDDSYFRRLLSKGLLYTAGTASLIAGVVLLAVQTTSIPCVVSSGTPDLPGPCLEAQQWPLISGLITLGVGVAAIVVAAVLRSVPTSEQEDKDLADGYNARLKPPSLPVTAWR